MHRIKKIIEEMVTGSIVKVGPEQLYDYTYLPKGRFFPVDVMLDNNHSYEYMGFPPCLFFRNGYEGQQEYVPIVLCEDPRRYLFHDLEITLKDYYYLENFVACYYRELLKVANEEMELFEDFLWKIQTKETLKESRSIISEMAIVRPSQSGLARKIWIDDGESFKKGGHWLRIKVQNEGNNSRNWATLTVPDYKWIGGDNISEDDKKKIVKYVKLNIELLASLMLKQIDINEYYAVSYKVDDKGNVVKKENIKEWIYVYDANHGIGVYKHNISPFGYIYSVDGKESLYKNQHGKPLIFDNTTPFNTKGITYANVGDNLFLLNVNGDITLM